MNTIREPAHRKIIRTIRRNRFKVLAVLLFSLLVTCCAVTREMGWSLSDMPSQQGRVFLVTGGNTGIGYESAKALAARGAQVVIASRNPDKGREAVASIKKQTPDARVHFEVLDLADPASVRALAKRLNETLPYLDGLINNAGIMTPPRRGASKEGFEMQFAVNYLGHFALTSELLPLLRKAKSPRVVTLSSIAATRGAIHFADLQSEQAYDPFAAYAQSKLACLMFALELQRRSDAGGWGIRSIASHPGISRTDLLVHHEGIQGFTRRNLPFLYQPAARGALPTLYAATAPDARGGGYYGPAGLAEIRGPVGPAKVPPAAGDAKSAARLWAVSEELTGIHYP